MSIYRPAVIKSFKHDGHLHRMWLENWQIPKEQLDPAHAEESMIVMVNSHTPIQEASGETWVSKVPGVSFFIPKTWYNIVALIEPAGVRYYCNIASPPYMQDDILTYIDYDLDVIVLPDGTVQVVDQADYEHNKALYHYSELVEKKVNGGLEDLLARIKADQPPFQEELIYRYFHAWLNDNK